MAGLIVGRNWNHMLNLVWKGNDRVHSLIPIIGLFLLTNAAMVKGEWKMDYKFSITNVLGEADEWGPVHTFANGESLWTKPDKTMWAWLDKGELVWKLSTNLVQSTLYVSGTRRMVRDRDSVVLIDSTGINRGGANLIFRRVTREGVQDLKIFNGVEYWDYTVDHETLGEKRMGIWIWRTLYPPFDLPVDPYGYWPEPYDVEAQYWTWVDDEPHVILTAGVIDGRVNVSWQTEIGKTYQLQVTSDLQTWEDHGARIYGDNNQAQIPMVGPGHRLVRVIEFD